MFRYGFDRKDCLNRAEMLLKKGDTASLRYACLELRQCIEAIAYEKVSTYIKFVPENKLNVWQPKQVFSFLEQIDPSSTKDYTFRIYKQEPDGSVGDIVSDIGHKTLKKKHFNKYYNKLGSYLHIPNLIEQTTYSEKTNQLQGFLVEVIEELRPLAECNFDSNFGMVFEVECDSCKEIIYLRKESLSVNSVFSCPKVECQVQYHVESIDENDNFTIRPRQFLLPCDCGRNNSVNIQNHKENYSLTCVCGKKYIVQKAWHYKESAPKNKSV